MWKLRGSAAEIRRLYEIEKLSLQEIAERFSTTKQAIHYQLVRLGVTLRRRGIQVQVRPSPLSEPIIKLYCDKGLSGFQVAERLGISPSRVYKCLEAHGIPRRRPPAWKRKYPELGNLKIGDSITVPKPNTRHRYYEGLYSMAKLVGIRVSVRTINETQVLLTRVE